MRGRAKVWLGVAVLAAMAAGGARAQDAAGAPPPPATPRPLEITAENLMAGDARHLAIGEQGGDASALLPGDVVRYRLRFTNVTDDSVRQIVFNNRMPPGLRYVDGSASGDRDDLRVEYSIDGGKSYSTRPMITETIEGEVVTRPAPPESYTHIRWTVSGWLAPAAQVTAEFRARLAGDQGEANESGEAGTSAAASGTSTP